MASAVLIRKRGSKGPSSEASYLEIKNSFPISSIRADNLIFGWNEVVSPCLDGAIAFRNGATAVAWIPKNFPWS